MTSGAKIVQSSYDYDTHTIGPYTLPFTLYYVNEHNEPNRFPVYKYYEALLRDEEAIAVFNVNNYCFCVVRRNMAYECAVRDNEKLDLVNFVYRQPLDIPYYERVGYIKSYHECLAVSQFPTSLVRVANSDTAYQFTEHFDGVPLVDPPLSLYKELLNHEDGAQAVYFDTISKQPKFLFK